MSKKTEGGRPFGSKPFFDPVRARAIGKRRLTRAARMFAKAHKWKLLDGAIRTPKGTVVAQTWGELGEALLRSGGLVKVKGGYADKYNGRTYD
jgi:hypothetical protein